MNISVALVLWASCNVLVISGQEFETTNGRVRGKTIASLGTLVDVFHGIPFAKPPTGELRFKYPEPVQPWKPEVKDATTERPSCIQPEHIYTATYIDYLRKPPMNFSEDCLYLSIWKPSSAGPGSKLAVLLWIYGGSFVSGSTTVPLYNGQYLAAENDVIIVSINYRVGPLGFTFLGSDTIPGNMGLTDQVEAMKWVKNNIENFGGDKERITIFGQSAGAASVGFHLLSPLSVNLFKYGILQSGVPIHKIGKQLFTSQVEAKDYAKQLSELVGCSILSDADMFTCLQNADIQRVNTATLQLFGKGIGFLPVIDGYFLPDDPMVIMEKGNFKKTSVMTGVTKDEITFSFPAFVNVTFPYMNSSTFDMYTTQITDMAAGSNKLKAVKVFYESQSPIPTDYVQMLNHVGTDITFTCAAALYSSLYSEFNDVYLYTVDHRISIIPSPTWMGVPHMYELEMVFGLVLNESLAATQEDKALSRTIMTYWTNFAKSGNPNSPAQVSTSWPVYDREGETHIVLDVGRNLATRQGFHRHQCAFINKILPMVSEKEDTLQPTSSHVDSRCQKDRGEKYGTTIDPYAVITMKE